MENYITGYDGYFRCNSTGNPTKVHLINPKTEKTFCGYGNDPFAQEYPADQFCVHRLDVCKHCLKGVNKITK